MTEWLIVLAVILAIMALVAIRYRRQITMGIQILKMFQQMRSAGKPKEVKTQKRENLKDVQLVRCDRCGKWISPSSALKLRANTYCSSVCMEKAAKLQSLVD